MILQTKTLERLRILINEETEYRSGPKLISFFHEFGFNETYGQGFPSRWVYTDEKLKNINGTPLLDACIKKLFSPVNYINRFQELDGFIKDFNQYIAFDKWQVVREQAEIKFVKTDKIKIDTGSTELNENEFLTKEFGEILLDKLGLEVAVTEVLEQRLEEIKKSLNNNSPLSVLFLSGSTLEGVLLGIAIKHPREFNQSKSAPKNKEGKIKQFQEWTLNNFIDVAYDVNLLKEDVKKFSHSLREFRNYIHPFAQVSTGFTPNKHTAKICWQVLSAAIHQLSENKL